MSTKTIYGYRDGNRTSLSIDSGFWEYFVAVCWKDHTNPQASREERLAAAEAWAKQSVERWIGEGCNSEKARYRILQTMVDHDVALAKDQMQGYADAGED